jgi:hypothetical protein
MTFLVPTSSGDSEEISATDGQSVISVIFDLVAGVRLSPVTVAVGSTATVTGSGFGPNTIVDISVDGSHIASASTDPLGTFKGDILVPAATGGQHIVRAQSGIRSATAAFSISPHLSVTPDSGQAGVQITAAGTGFGTARLVKLSFDRIELPEIMTDANGSCSVQFAPPPASSGNHTVMASDGIATAKASFTIKALVVVDPTSVVTGASVSISGTGFKPNSKINVRLDDGLPQASTSDEIGSFEQKFVIPGVDVGEHHLIASDGPDSATAALYVLASVRAEPGMVNIGDAISVSGKGLTGSLTIRYDDTVVGTVVADADGSYSTRINTPISIHGKHTIVVTNGSTTLDAQVAVESTPPPAPSVLKLAGPTQSPRPTFVWSAVSDPSGVTYVLQVASDPGFDNQVVQKSGLTTPRYTLSASERLGSTGKDGLYYWRVRAVDRASNESLFSSEGTFSVSYIPPWVIWLLVGIGGLILVMLILWARVKIWPLSSDSPRPEVKTLNQGDRGE